MAYNVSRARAIDLDLAGFFSHYSRALINVLYRSINLLVQNHDAYSYAYNANNLGSVDILTEQ
jgi:hypothetical protein